MIRSRTVLLGWSAGLLLTSCLGGAVRPPQTPTPSPQTLSEAREIDTAQLLIDDGLFDQARAHLDALFAHGCRHPEALMLRARLAFQQADFAQVIPWCKRATEASPLWLEPRVLQAQAWLKLKEFIEAQETFRDIDRLDPESPWGPYGIGIIASMRGDAKTAVAKLDLALQRDPKHTPSLQARAGVAQMQQDRVVEEEMLQRYVVEEPLDGFAFLRLGELARSSDRREDARRSFERAYQLIPLVEAARGLTELAHQRGDVEDERKWARLAGLPPPVEKSGAGSH